MRIPRLLQELFVCSTLALCAGTALNAWADDLPIGVFSSTALNRGWEATGTAFQRGLASGADLSRLEIENSPDSAVASSEMEGDGPVGTLTSPEFTIERKYIAFYIGGGDYEHDTCLNLLVGGKVVRSAVGWRSDRLAPASWDVTTFAGQGARVRLIDQASGDWGHLNVAHIVQTDNPPRLPAVTETLYQESLRPQFHFTARQWTMNRLNPGPKEEGWINDLNGLVYYDGEYHLFAQRWWKCWLHAVSRDLVHWTELEPAFWEEKCETGSQSGTCVIDYQNSSGLSPDASRPPMVAFWARNDNRSLCLCYSLDHGRTWEHYAKNPIMIYPERDPKVFWYPPNRRWVMLIYGNNQYHILNSTNLLQWTDTQKPIPNSFECPDLFELPVDGHSAEKKWVLIQGNGNYSIGNFDGQQFTEETGRFACDRGDFYATQTWANTETGDGRRIQAAWMRGANFPDMPFSQQVTFPCELTLHRTAGGLRVFRQPIREISSLHGRPDTWTNQVLAAGHLLPLEPNGRLYHVRAEVQIPEKAKLTLRIRGIPVLFSEKGLESTSPPATVADRVQTIELLVDRASIETFVNEGEVSYTKFVLPKENGLSVKAESGSVQIKSLTVWPLHSAWPNGMSD